MTLYLCYCTYDPDNYCGHVMRRLDSKTKEEAQQEGERFMDALWIYAKIEYLIVEMVTHHRLYDNKEKKHL